MIYYDNQSKNIDRANKLFSFVLFFALLFPNFFYIDIPVTLADETEADDTQVVTEAITPVTPESVQEVLVEENLTPTDLIQELPTLTGTPTDDSSVSQASTTATTTEELVDFLTQNTNFSETPIDPSILTSSSTEPNPLELDLNLDSLEAVFLEDKVLVEEKINPFASTTIISTENAELTLPERLSSPMVVRYKNRTSEIPLEISVMNSSVESILNGGETNFLYKDIFTNTDLQYEITKNGVKESIVLKDFGHPTEFRYQINLDEFDFVQASTSTVVLYKKGEKDNPFSKLYTLSAPKMVDKNGNENQNITFVIQDNVLVLTADANWLSEATYPIIIDPTIEISVLNVHSHPVQGEYWQVDFTTVGTADLTITPADQATIDDMEFTSLVCNGIEASPQIFPGDVIFYPNWSCDGVATVSHLDLKTGNHHLTFQFSNATEEVFAEAFNSAYTWDGGGADANWNTANNWSSNIVPTSADTATFDTCSSNCSPTINANVTIAGLTMTANYTGTITQSAAYTLTVTGSTGFNQAGGIFTGGSGVVDINDGSFTLSGGSFTSTSGILSTERNFTISGTGSFVHNSGTVTIDGNNNADISTLTCGTTTFNLFALSKAGSPPGTITIGSTCVLPLGSSPTSGGHITNNGTINIPTGNWTINPGSYIQNSGSTLSMTGTTITMTNSGTGNLQLAGGSFPASVTTITIVDGGLILPVGGTTPSGLTTLNVDKDIDNSGSLLPNGVAVTLTGNNNADSGTVTCGTVTFGSFAISKAGSPIGAITIGSSCAINLDSSTIAVGPFTNNGTITFNGTSFTAGTVTNSGTINLPSSTTFDVNAGSLVNNVGGTITYAGTNITIEGSWTQSGTFDITGKSLTFDGSVSLATFTCTGDFNATTGVGSVTIAKATTGGSDDSFIIPSGCTLTANVNTAATAKALVVSSGATLNATNNWVSGPVTNSGTITIPGTSFTAGGTLTNSGTMSLPSATTFDINNSGLVNNVGGTITYAGTNITIAGSWTQNGTFDITSKSLTFDSTSVLSTFNCTGDFNTTTSVGSVTVAKDINGQFTLASGCTLSANVNASTISGLLTVSSGATLTSTGNWVSGAVTNSGTITVSGTTFTTGATLTNSGTLNAASGTSTITTNFTNTGTFNHNNGTVSFTSANHTISGTTTFYNLVMTGLTSARTLTFASGSTQTVVGTLNLTGSSGKVLSLRSSSPGTEWSINPQGTRTVSYVNVQDSNNTNIATIYGGTGSVDSLNNTNWVFTTQPPNAPTSLGPTALVDGSWTADNTPTFTFTLSDPDGADTTKYHIQIDNTADFSSPVTDYTSALAVQGAATFTVGQAAGSGSYTVGAEGQTLADAAAYYWRVRALDNGSFSSAYSTANSGSIAFKVDATAPVTGSLTVDPTSAASLTATISGASDAGSGLSTTPYIFYNSTASTNSGATSSTSWLSTGLLPNTSYDFYATVSDLAGFSANTATVAKHTLANVPGTPSLGSPALTTLTLSNTENSNPALNPTTKFAVQITNTSPADSTWLNKWVDSAGSPSTTAVWLTDAQLDGLVITGLQLGTTYEAKSKARNEDLTETALSTAGSGTTLTDTTSPTPDPMTFASAPSPDSSTQISMTASTATDVTTPPVEYLFGYFSCTSNPGTGGTSSAWQSSAAFTDSGLQPNKCYGYKVQARDSSDALNQTASSSQAEIYTLANIPTGLTITVDSTTQLTATWTANSNPDGTEYQATNETAVTNSGWITATSSVFSSLTCGTTYSFTVQARNTDNTETASTASVSATTSACAVVTPPASSGTSGGSSSGNGRGGGGATPAGVLINGGATTTTSSITHISMQAPFDAQTMVISNSPDFASVATLPFVNYLSAWNLCEKNICQPGNFNVYVKFYNASGVPSKIYSDDIYVSGKLKADEPPGKPPRDVELGVIITASLDGSEYFGSLNQVPAGRSIYLQGSVAGKKSGDKITYKFDCESDALVDGVYEAIFENTPRKNIKTGPICSYSSAGYYLARVEVLSSSQTIYDSLIIQVSEPLVTLEPPLPEDVEPPIAILPPVLVPPISTTTPISFVEEIVTPIVTAVENFVSDDSGWVENILEQTSKFTSPLLYKVSNGIAGFTENVIYTTARFGKVTKEKLAIISSEPEVSIGISTMTLAPSVLVLQYSLGTQAINFANVKSLSDLWFMVISFFQGLLTSLGLRKKRRRWGTVYDSQTKQPIDPAIVELIDARSGKVLETSITDLLGRFGFLDKLGQYYIRVRKTHYIFPSKMITGVKDSIFDNVYHGELIEILKSGGVLAPNIPMDQMAFDWNQQEKQKIIKFYPNLELMVQMVLNILFWLGFAFVALNFVSNHTVLNGLFTSFYVLLAILNKFIPSRKLWGRIISDSVNVAGLLLEISPRRIPQVVVARALTAGGGRFFLKTSEGEYILRVKKVEGSDLTTILESQIRVGQDRVVNDTIRI